MENKELLTGVRKCLQDCVRVDLNEIQPDARLIDDLGADSLDLLDITFSLERHFGIKIKRGEIERIAREGIPPEEFEENGLLKPKGVERIRQALPEVPLDSIHEGMHTSQIPYLFTVETMARIVERGLAEKQAS